VVSKCSLFSNQGDKSQVQKLGGSTCAKVSQCHLTLLATGEVFEVLGYVVSSSKDEDRDEMGRTSASQRRRFRGGGKGKVRAHTCTSVHNVLTRTHS
jgi:hypothetical protein